MGGIQTASSLLDPEVKKQVDELLYEVSRLNKQLKEFTQSSTLGDVCATGHTTSTSIEANGLTTLDGTLIIKKGEYEWRFRIHPATGALGLYAGDEKTPRQEWKL